MKKGYTLFKCTVEVYESVKTFHKTVQETEPKKKKKKIESQSDTGSDSDEKSKNNLSYFKLFNNFSLNRINSN